MSEKDTTVTEETGSEAMTKKQQKKADKKAKKEEKKAKKKKISVGKRILRIIIIILVIVIVIYGVLLGITKSQEINYVFSAFSNAVTAVNDGTWEDDVNGGGESAIAADSNIGDFVAGTYGGVEFNSMEDAVNYYVEAYNATKAETANYIDGDGNTVSYYALLGDEDLQIGDILVDGSQNSLIDGLVPGIVSGMFAASVYGLPPCNNRDPGLDVDENNESLVESRITPDDIAAVVVSENDDGTIKMVLQAVPTEMSHKGMDAQGNLFNTLGAIDSTVESISVLSWSQGTTAENCKVTYEDGTATVTIDPSTGKITEADYNMLVTVDVIHANVSVIKDKSASLQIAYVQHFPASDEYLKSSRDLTRA